MGELGLLVVQVLWLIAPLIFASAVAGVVLRKNLLPALAKPIDGGRSYRGVRLFGDGKTWRGVLVAVVSCIVAVFVQARVVGDVGPFAPFDYERVNPFLLGAALGIGATLGELPNSFVKRRLGYGRGESPRRGPLAVLIWIWDQVDLLVTTWPLLLLWFTPSRELVVVSFVVVLILHPTVSVIGYRIGARRTAR